jgi:putative ABC transport system substrate-binding protein
MSAVPPNRIADIGGCRRVDRTRTFSEPLERFNGRPRAQIPVTRAIVPVEARNPQEIESAFAEFDKQRVQAFIVAGDAVFFTQRRQIADLALRNRLPSMFSQREYAQTGGLMSYGENLSEFFRRAASFVDKIFKGAKPDDLPIEQPTRFNLVINRKTADALGVTIPAQLYIFADEVIE